MTDRVALYARYSSDQQREASIEDQLRLCTARAEKEGWTVTGTWSDAAISGATLLRPGYQALLAAMRAGAVDIVLAESLDRFSRDLEHVAAFHKQARFCGVRIVTLADGESSEMAVGFKGTMGALYLRDLAARTHRGLEGRVRQGRAIAAPPYGYRVVRRLGADGEPERGLREIDPAEATVLGRVFRDYVGGFSPRAIARALNTEGIPGPRGGIWYDQTLRGRPGRADGLLRNPLYAGRLVWNRYSATTDPQTGARVWRQKDRQEVVERRIANLVDAIADGLKAPGLQQKLDELGARRAALRAQMQAVPPAAPALHPNLAQLYADRVASLRRALDAGDGAEVLESARALIDTVTVSPPPPDRPDGPPEIELAGNLIEMLRAGGARLDPDPHPPFSHARQFGKRRYGGRAPAGAREPGPWIRFCPSATV